MKKILAFLLVAVLTVAFFAIPTAAASTNAKVDIPFTKTAPVVDGNVKSGEYVKATPFHSFDKNNDEFVTTLDKYADWGFDFYICWDAENLYMAWVVDSDIQTVISKEDDKNGNGVPGEAGDLAYMWEKSCVQFILTTGAPDKSKLTYQTGQWSGNYLEVGLAILPDGDSYKVAWSIPDDESGNDYPLTTTDWNFAGKKGTGTMTYEVQIPWNKSGVMHVGNGCQFGLTYAVAAQEDYNVKAGMIEWQDAILGSKAADAAAIVTMTGKSDDKVEEISQVVAPKLEEGTLPSNYKIGESVGLTLDTVDTAITTGKSTLVTDPAKVANYNSSYCYGMLLNPGEAEGEYVVAEGVTGPGEGNPIAFTATAEEGAVVALFHTDAADSADASALRVAAAKAIAAGTKVYLFGVDVAAKERTYSNAMIFTADAPIPAESSAAEETSEVVSEASKDASEVESDVTSADETSAEESTAEGGNGGFPIWAIIVIIVVVLAIAGVLVYFFVIKKKK